MKFKLWLENVNAITWKQTEMMGVNKLDGSINGKQYFTIYMQNIQNQPFFTLWDIKDAIMSDSNVEKVQQMAEKIWHAQSLGQRLARSPNFKWQNGTIPTIARQILEDKKWDELHVLADAIEDSGYQDDELLSIIRSPIGLWLHTKPIEAALLGMLGS